MMSTYSLFLVIAQFSLIGFLIWNGNILQWNPFVLILQAAGLLIAFWGAFTIKIGNFNIQPEVKAVLLVTSGPFKWIRNPMYLGILAIFIPAALLEENILQQILCLLLIVVLVLKIRREEQLLYKRFCTSYLLYKKKTWRLIPYVY